MLPAHPILNRIGFVLKAAKTIGLWPKNQYNSLFLRGYRFHLLNFQVFPPGRKRRDTNPLPAQQPYRCSKTSQHMKQQRQKQGCLVGL